MIHFLKIKNKLLEGVDHKDTPSPNPRKLIEELNCLHLQVKNVETLGPNN
jgi:hypothetical protein